MNRVAAGAIAIVLAILLVGCAQRRLTAQCRWVGEDDVVYYSGCANAKAGEYVVTLGLDTKVNLINETFGQYRIKSVREVKTSLQGTQHVRLYLVTLIDDPGHQKMYELSRQASGWFADRYIAVTPNYNH